MNTSEIELNRTLEFCAFRDKLKEKTKADIAELEKELRTCQDLKRRGFIERELIILNEYLEGERK